MHLNNYYGLILVALIVSSKNNFYSIPTVADTIVEH